ncbi:hypothetical protein BDQ17DRAFT_1430467 [Cyathus striatus]|nr:hypothetical protein BDQ17DRAFT_1430467 [Cyathus striatus]
MSPLQASWSLEEVPLIQQSPLLLHQYLEPQLHPLPSQLTKKIGLPLLQHLNLSLQERLVVWSSQSTNEVLATFSNLTYPTNSMISLSMSTTEKLLNPLLLQHLGGFSQSSNPEMTHQSQRVAVLSCRYWSHFPYSIIWKALYSYFFSCILSFLTEAF